MYRIKFIFAFILFTTSMVAQKNDVSRVLYKKGFYHEVDEKSKNQDINKINDEITKMVDKIEYELIFNNNKSIYRIVNSLKIENPLIYKLAAGPPIIFFNNLKNNFSIRNTQTLGVSFNIKAEFNKYNWTITKEKKKIGNYVCYKATCEYLEYNPVTKTHNKFSPEVWFTPEIASPYGPEGFGGLPGLILEATLNGQTYYVAKLVELQKYNISNFKIEKPKGKEINESEYQKLLAKRID